MRIGKLLLHRVEAVSQHISVLALRSDACLGSLQQRHGLIGERDGSAAVGVGRIGAGTFGVPALLCSLRSGFCGAPIGIRCIRPCHHRIGVGVRHLPDLLCPISSRPLGCEVSLERGDMPL